jgi:hypothetical protein
VRISFGGALSTKSISQVKDDAGGTGFRAGIASTATRFPSHVRPFTLGTQIAGGAHMNIRWLGLLLVLVACDQAKKDPDPAPAVAATATAPATATATVTAAATAPVAAPTTSVVTGVGNGNGKAVTAATGPGGANVNLQNKGKSGNIGTTPGNVQIQGAAGTVNIPTGGGLPSR